MNFFENYKIASKKGIEGVPPGLQLLSNTISNAVNQSLGPPFTPSVFSSTIMSSNLPIDVKNLMFDVSGLNSAYEAAILSAITAQLTPMPPQAAWASVTPTILALQTSVPPILLGTLDGAIFWLVLINTIGMTVPGVQLTII